LLRFRRRFRAFFADLALLLALAVSAAPLRGQSPLYPEHGWSTPRRSWSVFTEYSPDSSHIMLGITGGRTFATVGASWSQRLYKGRSWQLFYAPEVRPLMIERDPVQTGIDYKICIANTLGQPCTPQSGYYHYPHAIPSLSTSVKEVDYSASFAGQSYYQDYSFNYGRRSTYVGGLSPLGFQAAFLPRSRLQPIAGATAGFAVSPRDIPMFYTSAFNFTFGFGAGLQFWRDPRHATRVEYRFQHLSNADIGYNDPGIDSQMIHISYVWGLR
jgi:Lipid A 3-O-deacylase (PagL)